MESAVQLLEKLLQTPGAQLLVIALLVVVFVFAVVIVGGLYLFNKFVPVIIEARRQGVGTDSATVMNTLLDQHGRTVSLLETKMEADKERDETNRATIETLKAITENLNVLGHETRVGVEAMRQEAITQYNTLVGKLDTVQAEALQILGDRIDSAEKSLLNALQASVSNGSPIIIGVFTVNQKGLVVWANLYAQKMFEGIIGSNVHQDEAVLFDVNGTQLPREVHPISMALYRHEAPSPTIIGVKYNHSVDLLWVLMNIEIVFQDGVCTGAVVTTASLSSVLSAMGIALKLS